MKKIIIISLNLAIFIALVYFAWLPSKNRPKFNQSIIKVGVAADYPPFAFIKDNQIVGFDIDLINQIAQKLEIKGKGNFAVKTR